MYREKQDYQVWIMIICLAIVAYFAITSIQGCSSAPVDNKTGVPVKTIMPTPVITSVPIVASPSPIAVVYPRKGWIHEYDNYIKELVTERMLNQPNSRMIKFCDVWPKLTIEQKKQMYADLLYSIAYPESNYDNQSIYLESTMSSDELTGLPTMSEGLEQLSYQDANSYGKGCAFDWKKDYKKLKDDIEKGRKFSIYPERDTLNPFKNLLCSMTIIDLHLKISNDEFADSLSQYWYTMNRSHEEEYAQVWEKMRERKSPCH